MPKTRKTREKFRYAYFKNDVTLEGEKELQGHGLLSREGPDPFFRNMIKSYGMMNIAAITINRIPVNSLVQKFLNFLTNNEMSKNVQMLDKRFGGTTYDDLFHLGLVISLSDPPGESSDTGPVRIRLEKLVTPHISIVKEQTLSGESIQVALKGPITLNDFINKTNAAVPEERLWHYDALNANCQIFCKDLLTSNGLWTSALQTFTMQNAGELLNVNKPAVSIIRKLPKLAEALGVLVFGKGRKRLRNE